MSIPNIDNEIFVIWHSTLTASLVVNNNNNNSRRRKSFQFASSVLNDAAHTAPVVFPAPGTADELAEETRPAFPVLSVTRIPLAMPKPQKYWDSSSLPTNQPTTLHPQLAPFPPATAVEAGPGNSRGLSTEHLNSGCLSPATWQKM